MSNKHLLRRFKNVYRIMDKNPKIQCIQGPSIITSLTYKVSNSSYNYIILCCAMNNKQKYVHAQLLSL